MDSAPLREEREKETHSSTHTLKYPNAHIEAFAYTHRGEKKLLV